jgi:hypothetical protein
MPLLNSYLQALTSYRIGALPEIRILLLYGQLNRNGNLMYGTGVQ